MPVVQAICLILVAAFIIVNTVVDIFYAVIDPRIGPGGAARERAASPRGRRHNVRRASAAGRRWVGVVSASSSSCSRSSRSSRPWLAPHDPNAIDLLHPYAGPSAQHLLGTDDTGRDLLSRLIAGRGRAWSGR